MSEPLKRAEAGRAKSTLDAAGHCSLEEMASSYADQMSPEQALQLDAILSTPAPRRRADIHAAYGDYFDIGGCLQELDSASPSPGIREHLTWGLGAAADNDELEIDPKLIAALSGALSRVIPRSPLATARLKKESCEPDDKGASGQAPDPEGAQDPQKAMWVPDKVEVKASALPALGKPTGKKASRKIPAQTSASPAPEEVPDVSAGAGAAQVKIAERGPVVEPEYSFKPPPVVETALSNLTLNDIVEFEAPWRLGSLSSATTLR